MFVFVFVSLDSPVIFTYLAFMEPFHREKNGRRKEEKKVVLGELAKSA